MQLCQRCGLETQTLINGRCSPCFWAASQNANPEDWKHPMKTVTIEDLENDVKIVEHLKMNRPMKLVFSGTEERDPHGADAHSPGAKLDAGKADSSLLLSFGRALNAVAEIGTFGAKKYTRDGWESVPEGFIRYTAAMMRHLLKEKYEEDDPDSGLLHAAHAAWNALARLELMLREPKAPSAYLDDYPPFYPKIVCLCGSTRFGEAFKKAMLAETLAGKIVLSVGCHDASDEQLGVTEDQKKMFDELHLRKIDLSDEVLILNVGGYIGQSTRAELEYARSKNIPIRFLEDE